jgi:hypothetical protein
LTTNPDPNKRITRAPATCEKLLRGLPGLKNLGDYNLTKNDLLIR